ncbi:MAG TPA: VCBS repeat-containing protein [Candidatus Eisenbacteria bacterium]|nr:VCBS repeat-containing protein [Candidatus Eisenbacteria bacterium]
MRPTKSSTYLLPALIALTLAAPRDATAVCQPAPFSYDTGPNPLYTTSADFNEDGTLDLAVTNSDVLNGGVNNSVAILLGTGNLHYAAPVLYPVQLNPHMIATGDFNEDGITDLVTANKWSSTVSILLGNGANGAGNGTFAAAVHYAAGGWPFQIVVEDLDRDGITDLAVSLNNQYAVALLRGRGANGVGDGTFDPPSTLALDYFSTGLEKGDFNGDGITDLVATQNSHGTIAMFLGTGAPTLGPTSFVGRIQIPAGPLPFEFAVADYNEDGKLDLAVAQQTTAGGGGTLIMMGNGNGTFSPAGTYPTGNTVAVTPDDLNQDGITDLAIAEITGGNTGTLRIFFGGGINGVGNGAFQEASTHTGIGDPYQILAGDFDADGRRDLVVTYNLTTHIAVFPGACDNGPSPPPPPDPRFPVLTDVRDVPHDDGGRVFLTWTRSSLDVSGGPVNAYRVWRRIPPAIANARASSSRGAWLARAADGAGTTIEYWEALVTLPAQRLAGYGYTAATTQDSIDGSNPWTAFFVSALTSNIDVFYSSNVDSGYSVDNTAPEQPAAFTAQNQGGQVALAWEASPAVDFAEFRLYRGGEPGFVPGAGNLVSAGAETGFVDSHPSAPGSWYKLVALDIHGNQSPFAVASPTGPTGVEGPSGHRLTLREPVPNPGDGRSMLVAFSLRDASRARLEVLDVAGRMVFGRDVGALGAGAHRIDVARDGAFRAGLYFIRLTQGAEKLLTRAAVIR